MTNEQDDKTPPSTPTPTEGTPLRKAEDIAPTPTPSTGSPLRENNGDSEE